MPIYSLQVKRKRLARPRQKKTKTKKCRSAAGGGRRGPKQVAVGAFTASRILSQAGKRPLFQVRFDFRRTQCQVIIFLVTFSSACPLAPSISYLLTSKYISAKLPSSASSQFLPTEQHPRSSLPLLDWAKNRLLSGQQGTTTDTPYFPMTVFNSASWGLASEREYVPMTTRESGRPSVCSTFFLERAQL